MRFAKLALAPIAAMALTAAPALAQDVAVGATVYGPEGAVVGTIESVANGQAVVDTGKHKVPLGVAMYGPGENGPTITVTKDQLEAMVDAQIADAMARRDAALTVGAAVLTADAQELGTVETVDGDTIVIVRGDAADKVTLLREYFSATDTGLTARLTMEQIDAALAAQAAAE